MAITASCCRRNDAVALEKYTATGTFSIGLGDKPGEKVIILIENNNTSTGTTATVEVLAGYYLANVYGTLSVDVEKESSAIIGPLETVRYKNTASEVDCSIKFGTTAASEGGTIGNVKVAVIKLP